MSNYLSVCGQCVTQKVIEKSRFITTSAHVEGEEQAKAFVASVAKRYADATHNCYAYICDAAGNFLRFSDDGEPQGTAGMPILAVEDIEGYLPFPQKPGKELFALHVSGLSMRDAGILDGDYVVAERVSTADDGDIVVAMIDDEATVKRLYREKNQVRLQPENPDFQPIYSDHASVLGKVIAVMRYY